MIGVEGIPESRRVPRDFVWASSTCADTMNVPKRQHNILCLTDAGTRFVPRTRSAYRFHANVQELLSPKIPRICCPSEVSAEDDHWFINVDAFLFRVRESEVTVVHEVSYIDTYCICLHVAIVPSHTTNLGHSLNSDDPFQVKVCEILCQLIWR